MLPESKSVMKAVRKLSEKSFWVPVDAVAEETEMEREKVIRVLCVLARKELIDLKESQYTPMGGAPMHRIIACALTEGARHIWAKRFDDLCRFLIYSVLVPILVAIATSILTWIVCG